MKKLDRYGHYYCSNCHRIFMFNEFECNYCCNCGKKIKKWDKFKKDSFDTRQKEFRLIYKEELKNGTHK